MKTKAAISIIALIKPEMTLCIYVHIYALDFLVNQTNKNDASVHHCKSLHIQYTYCLIYLNKMFTSLDVIFIIKFLVGQNNILSFLGFL